MNKENPYKTPETIQPQHRTSDGSPLAQMERKRFKKLYYRSVNVGTIAFLLIIGVIALAWLLYKQKTIAEANHNTIIISPIFYISTIFSILAAIGLFMRASWGRIVGIIACALMLINIPIGTIIGIAGLVALFQAPELFGNNRFLHKDLKKEYKKRKREKRF